MINQRFHGAMRLCIASAVIASLSLPFAAAAKERPDDGFAFDVVADSAHFDGTQQLVAKRGRALAQVELSMPLAVQLDGEVTAEVQEAVAGGPNSPLTPGTVLWSNARNNNIYCGALWSRSFGKAGPCLQDTDNDGKFDVAIKGGAMAVRPQGIGLSNNSMLGIDFAKPVPLPAPIAYRAAPSSSGPRTKADLTWALMYKSGKTGPATIYVQLQANNNWQGTGFLSDSTDIVYSGSPVSVDLNGVRLTVHGLGPKKELIYSLDGAFSATPIKLKFLDRVTTTVIFI